MYRMLFQRIISRSRPTLRTIGIVLMNFVLGVLISIGVFLVRWQIGSQLAFAFFAGAHHGPCICILGQRQSLVEVDLILDWPGNSILHYSAGRYAGIGLLTHVDPSTGNGMMGTLTDGTAAINFYQYSGTPQKQSTPVSFHPYNSRIIYASSTKTLEFFLCLLLPVCIFVDISIVAKLIRSRRLSARGNCAKCGYDLRATPDRCPECGTVPKHLTKPE
jgi:hypothetical protein